ncbi:MAG: conjugal transfer protein TrbB, partial [Rhodobiaceae bacterium]|nr:conjugal transfer protein TrbB [Rhodobiaceae bacterium]
NGEAVDLVDSIERTATGRRVRDVMRVNGFEHGHYQTDHFPQIDEDSHAA